MKLCNIIADGRIHLGVVTGRGVVDAAAAGFEPDMDAVIAGAGLDELRRIERDGSLPAVEEPEYANVVCRPGKLLCVGLNYRDHAAGINMKAPEQPVLFSKFANALVPSGAQVELPGWEQSYDYEAELVIVIGRKAWGVDEAAAMDCVFGYTCGNDLSCREAQLRSGQWLIGKTMPGFGPCGPCIATADSIDPAAGLRVRSYVNGLLRQDGSTADMIFNCAKVISYASKYLRLEPGDLIFTGTPSGVALEHKDGHSRWIKAGDRVDIVIEGVGTLSNTMK